MAANLTDVYKYMSDNGENGYTLPDFRRDWEVLSAEEKEWFKSAVGEATGK